MMLFALPTSRTLIVEDDRDSCETLAVMLRRLGHDVECAESAGEALVRMEETQPQCVLLDLMLPDASGGLILRKIRAEKLPIKVAVITAAGSGSPALKYALGWEPDAVFHKPLDFDALRKWLEKSNLPN
jgi:DNA-binding response OmpR family regulator